MPYEEDKIIHDDPDEYFDYLTDVIEEHYNTNLWFKSGRDKRKYHIMKGGGQ